MRRMGGKKHRANSRRHDEEHVLHVEQGITGNKGRTAGAQVRNEGGTGGNERDGMERAEAVLGKVRDAERQ